MAGAGVDPSQKKTPGIRGYTTSSTIHSLRKETKRGRNAAQNGDSPSLPYTQPCFGPKGAKKISIARSIPLEQGCADTRQAYLVPLLNHLK